MRKTRQLSETSWPRLGLVIFPKTARGPGSRSMPTVSLTSTRRLKPARPCKPGGLGWRNAGAVLRVGSKKITLLPPSLWIETEPCDIPEGKQAVHNGSKLGYISNGVEENFQFLRTFWQRYWGRPPVEHRRQVVDDCAQTVGPTPNLECHQLSGAELATVAAAMAGSAEGGLATKPPLCPLLLGTHLPFSFNVGYSVAKFMRFLGTCVRSMSPNRETHIGGLPTSSAALPWHPCRCSLFTCHAESHASG